MASEGIPVDVAAYAAAVRTALEDLPQGEREAPLEDLEDHLAEVAAESADPLETRLGTPADYAAELRFAYGIGRPDSAVPGIFKRTFSPVRAWFDGSDSFQAVRAFMPELRPGWWVLRGYLVAVVLAVVFRNGNDVRPIPNPFSSHGLLEIVIAVVAIAVSVRIGRGSVPAGRWRRLLAWAPNAFIGLAGLAALGSMGTGYSWASSVGTAVPQELGPYSSAAAFPGRVVTNIYPYRADGKPLQDVLLYDQNGQPLNVEAKAFGVTTQFPIAADGKPVLNEYPQKQTGPDGSPVTPPRVAIPPTSPPSPAPTPSANPSPTPTP